MYHEIPSVQKASPYFSTRCLLYFIFKETFDTLETLAEILELRKARILHSRGNRYIEVQLSLRGHSAPSNDEMHLLVLLRKKKNLARAISWVLEPDLFDRLLHLLT